MKLKFVIISVISIIFILFWNLSTAITVLHLEENEATSLHLKHKLLNILLRKWAPLVWLAPGEKFMPLSVNEFLENVHTENLPPIKNNRFTNFLTRTNDDNSSIERSYLVTNDDIDNLLLNTSSFLYGKNPANFTVPVYVTVKLCNDNVVKKKQKSLYIPLESTNDDGNNDNLLAFKYKMIRQKRNVNASFMANIAHNIKFTTEYKETTNDVTNLNGTHKANRTLSMKRYSITTTKETILPSFHATFWMFYPYSQGKTVCTLNLGPLGLIPLPSIFGKCFGNYRDIGNHIGDWEHMSLYFQAGSYAPEMMYVSAHDAGAYYSYNHLTGTFEFQRQETRKGLLQKPKFPKTVITTSNHPILFAALGSHGLWTAPGKHRFVRVAKLYDINGFGTPWYTWKSLNIFHENLDIKNLIVPEWLHFKGKWGNPKSKCHPLRRIGLNFCEFTDGPSGIPSKKAHFQCTS